MANNHYQQLETFRKELSESGRSITKKELRLRANKIVELMKECKALTDNPAVDKSTIPQITDQHLAELQQWLTVSAVLNEGEPTENARLIPVQHFRYDNKEKPLSIAPRYSMYSTSADSWHLEWPEFRDTVTSYHK